MYISHFWGDLYAILHNGDIRFSLMCVKVYFSHTPNSTFYVLFFFFLNNHQGQNRRLSLNHYFFWSSFNSHQHQYSFIFLMVMYISKAMIFEIISIESRLFRRLFFILVPYTIWKSNIYQINYLTFSLVGYLFIYFFCKIII